MIPCLERLHADATCSVPLRIVARAGGGNVRQAFEQVALAMFNYMTPLSGVSIDDSATR